jgi:hypothetical protein
VALEAPAPIRAHHHPGSRIEKTHLQGGFQIDATVGAQQEHGTGLANTSMLKGIGVPHIANHPLLILPHIHTHGQWSKVKAVQGNVEMPKGAKAGVTQSAQPADHNELSGVIHCVWMTSGGKDAHMPMAGSG